MKQYLSMDKQQMSSLNKRNVIRCIQENQPINRSAIAHMIGLSIPAVMTITNELLSHGIIQSEGKADSGVGKHPELLSISGENFRYIGVDVGRINMRAVITGQDGTVLGSVQTITANGEYPERCAEDICALINQVIAESGVEENTIVGVCVAMPGLIEQDTGIVIFSPDFGWKDVPLQQWINEKLGGIKAVVKNANRAQARWEIRPGRSLDYRQATVFCIGLGYGIGSAMITNGVMHYGASGTSGEIGHITVNPSGPVCLCGNNGCLEAMASGYAMEKQARQIAQYDSTCLLNRLAKGDMENITAKLVFQAAEMQDAIALNIVDQAAKYIGIALATAINMLDPDIIYLCGGLMKNGPEFMDKIKKYTRERQMHLAGKHAKICLGSMEDYNVAKGATLMIQDSGNEFEALSFLY